MTFTPDDLLAAAAREADIYHQERIPAMLRAGAEAMRKLQAMHRRAQRSEGKAQRTDALLASVLGAIQRHRVEKTTPSLWHLMQDVQAAKDHAQAATGRAFTAHFNFYYYREQELLAKLSAAEAKLAALQEKPHD